MSENDFGCFASTGVNMPLRAMFYCKCIIAGLGIASRIPRRSPRRWFVCLDRHAVQKRASRPSLQLKDHTERRG